MTIESNSVQTVIRDVINANDYRHNVFDVLNADFLQYTIDFFKKVVSAKLECEDITIDWYKRTFLHCSLDKEDIAIHSGLNLKSINNAYNTTKKDVVIDASTNNYDSFNQLINSLIDENEELDLQLTIKFRAVSVELNINESLIVINSLAVKRSQLSGGLWSSVGKQVEKPLIETLCKIFDVPPQYYDQSNVPSTLREIDFYLIDNEGNYHKSEVKLMGKGNPESADVIHARDTEIFIGDKLSDTNKLQFDQNGVQWVELRIINGYQRFTTVLNHFRIPYTPFEGDVNIKLDEIFTRNG